MKYRYFPEYGKLLPLPEVSYPSDFDYIGYEGWDEYTKQLHAEWLSKGIPVPDEHLKFFEVDRDESEFEVRHQIFSREGKWLDCPKEVYERHSGLLQRETRLVAIPKESKEGSRSLAVLTAEHNKNTLTKILQKKESKEQVDSPIEDRIKELAVDFAFENFPRNGVTYQDVIKLYDEWLSGNGYHQTRLSTPKQITQ
jgi:hypothetical protein